MSGRGGGRSVAAMLRLALKTALVTGAALGCLTSVAAADSIVYIDQGNVWVAEPDGSGKVQLTDGGSWHSPTQADDGTIAAVNGTGPITVMAKDGRVLREITTPAAKSGDGGTFAPAPKQLAFSPDGTKIAYAYLGYSCPVASTCGTVQKSVFYTRADVTEATPHSEWGNQHSVRNPEWITNSRVLVSGGFGSHMNFDDLDAGDYNHVNWFNDMDSDLGDGEISRDHKRLAAVYSYAENTQLRFYAVSGDVTSGPPPADPELACQSNDKDVNYSDPSWSPDSQSVAFANSQGIEVLKLTDVGPGTCTSGGPSSLVVPGGSQPDWGPADPATARYVAPKPDPTEVYPQPHVQPDPTVTPATSPLVVGAKARQRLGALAVTCSVTTAGPCTATAKVKVGKRTYRSKKARGAAAAGKPATLKLRFDAKAARAIRRALRPGRTLKAVVVVTAGGVSAERAVVVRR